MGDGQRVAAAGGSGYESEQQYAEEELEQWQRGRCGKHRRRSWEYIAHTAPRNYLVAACQGLLKIECKKCTSVQRPGRLWTT